VLPVSLSISVVQKFATKIATKGVARMQKVGAAIGGVPPFFERGG